jgi:hypothetical protein
MRQFFAFLFSFLICAQGALAQSGYVPPPANPNGVADTASIVTDDDETGSLPNSRQLKDGTNTTVDVATPGQIKVNAGAYQGSTVVPGTNGNVMTSNGTAWTSAAAAGGGGGGSSPFVPKGFTPLTDFDDWNDLCVSPDGLYVYVTADLTATSKVAVTKISVATGSVEATLDLNEAFDNPNICISPDGASVYVVNGSTSWFKIATSGMTLTHHSTLAVGLPASSAGRQAFDLSPNGAIYAYASAADAKLYMVNTSTYAETNQTMNHTAGNLTAVCFYNGSNTDVYVAHDAQDDVDKYVIGGAYDSTISTGATGTPAFTAMRSGINGSFFIADQGTGRQLIAVNSGTPVLYPTPSNPYALCTNYLSPTAIDDGEDVCYFNSGSVPMCVDYDFGGGLPALFAVPAPQAFIDNGIAGLACSPNTSQNLFTLGGVNYPELWSFAAVLPDVTTTPNTAGNLKTSDGKGNWTSAAPFSTTGFTGSDTVGGGGTVTVTNAIATTSSVILVMPTSSVALPPAVTTRSAGSFVVTGTIGATFDYCIVKP